MLPAHAAFGWLGPGLKTPLLPLLQTARYQRKLMRVAVELLKPGGTMVYSTCSISPGELSFAHSTAISAYVKKTCACAESR